MTQRRICLVSSSHVGSNPRLVKSADALHEAGYDVRVVSADVSPSVRTRDADVLRRVAWRHAPVGRGSAMGHLARVALQRAASATRFAPVPGSWRTTAWSESWLWRRLAQAAASEPADLYIGHNLPALPAVVVAAARRGVPCAFDLEDDHCGELPREMRDSARYRQRDALMRALLPRCRVVTAASPGIAREVGQRCGIVAQVVLNTFPLAERNGVAPPPRQLGTPLRLYWYSQTVGPDRGLSAAIAALGATGVPVLLTLRGHADADARAELERQANAAGVELVFLPLASPNDMTRLAAEHDIGVCVELADGGNRDIALANKVFTYLLAGMPVLLSDTRAHREFAADLDDVALVADLSVHGTAGALRAWLMDHDGLRSRAGRAWRLGTTRYNWEVEKATLLDAVGEALGE